MGLKVREKILLMLVAFAIIPTVFIIGVHLPSDSKTIENLQINRMTAVMRTSAAAFSEIMGLRKEEFGLVSANWSVRDYVEAKGRSGPRHAETIEALKGVKTYFNTYVSTIRTFDDLLFLDENGVVVAGVHPETIGMDLSESDYFTRAFEPAYANKVFSSTVHEPLASEANPDERYLALSSVLYSADGEVAGVLVAYLSTSIIAEFSRNIHFGETGIAFVTDSRNYILFHPEPRFFNAYTAAPKLTTLFQKWRQGSGDGTGLIDDRLGSQRFIMYYQIMPDCELMLVLRQDYEEFVADRNAMAQSALIAIGVATVLACLVGFFFAKSFMRPVQQLHKAFTSGRQEGSYVECHLTRDDEFGELARCYNDMISKLSLQHQLTEQEKDKNIFMATHDRVTGLPNRVSFEKNLQTMLTADVQGAVFYADIDNMKQVNEVYGHPAGDAVLCEVAKRMKALGFDECARVGGDEFVLILKGNATDISQMSQRFLESMLTPFELADLTLQVSISAGIAAFPEHGQSPDALITNSDMAMHVAKANGKKQISFFNEAMRSRVSRQNAVMRILRDSFDNSEAFLMYQPIFKPSDKSIVGFEALMRIKSTQVGLISPTEFIPVAESDISVILQLGEWCIRTALQFMSRLQREANFTGYIAVNISLAQIRHPDFVQSVLALLANEGIAPRQLQLEITETIVLGCVEDLKEQLAALRQAGVRIALDDFGTQSSSLYYLIHIPLDVVKVDPAFFKNIHNDRRIAIINRTVVDLAHSFGITIAAEGVERQLEYEELTPLGFDEMQGFYCYRPVMADGAVQTLKALEQQTNPSPT